MLEEFEHDVSEVVIVPSSGGVFEVTLGGEKVFSKKESGRHPEYEEILRVVRERLT